MKNIKKNAGFTLIELMIVVAIIGILAAIAIPNFIRYQLKSKEAEAKAVIGGIKTSNEAFRAEYDGYATDAGNPGLGGIGTNKVAWAVAACPSGCNRTAIGACTNFDCIGYAPQGPVYFNYQLLANNAGIPEWGVIATSNLDGDAVNNIIHFATDNAPAAVNSALAVCAGGNEGEVVDCLPMEY